MGVFCTEMGMMLMCFWLPETRNRSFVLYLGLEKVKQLSEVAGTAKNRKPLAVMGHFEIFGNGHLKHYG